MSSVRLKIRDRARVRVKVRDRVFGAKRVTPRSHEIWDEIKIFHTNPGGYRH